jgi:hypothetical protein
MGKTFRREKTGKGNYSKLHTHRDLPDFQDLTDYDERGFPLDGDEGEDYVELYFKKPDVERPEDESSGKNHKRKR